jgi:hypothetical protein
MLIFINGEPKSKYQALNHYIISNQSADIEELKMIFTKACTINGEDQRDMLLSDGIEIIIE